MLRIWDSHNKQWLEAMSIIFEEDGGIAILNANKPGEEPLSDGWYSLKGDDLKKVAVVGLISHNPHLLPPPAPESHGVLPQLAPEWKQKADSIVEFMPDEEVHKSNCSHAYVSGSRDYMEAVERERLSDLEFWKACHRKYVEVGKENLAYDAMVIISYLEAKGTTPIKPILK